jgi:hypothetical protein
MSDGLVLRWTHKGVACPNTCENFLMSMGATLRLKRVTNRTFRAESSVKIVLGSSGHPAHPTVLFKVVFFLTFSSFANQ